MSEEARTEQRPRRYRKKPVEIEAMQWDGTPEGASAIIDWVLATGEHSARWHEERVTPLKPDSSTEGRFGRAWRDLDGESFWVEPPHIAINTLEGVMLAVEGDFVIRGVKGEFYPCKPDIFAATYEAVIGV